MDKFVIRQIVSIITRKHFRKTWMRLNKIHLVPVYSYLIKISFDPKFWWTKFSRQKSQPVLTANSTANLVASFPSVTLPFCHPHALTPLCFKVLPARVCSVNLRLLTHTTPLFCFFYFKLLFSKTLGLVVIYSSISIDDPFRLSRPTKLYCKTQTWTQMSFRGGAVVRRISPVETRRDIIRSRGNPDERGRAPIQG